MSDIAAPANHLNRDWLFQKYATEKLSTYEIGALVGRDPKRVYEKLRDFGIPTRPRGANLSNKDNFMLKNPGQNPFRGKTHSAKTRAILSEKASVPKPYLMGANNGMSGRTGNLNPNFRDGSSPERQRLYASGEWKEFVRVIYKRDNYRCRKCGASKIGKRGLHVHHRAPWAGNPELRFKESNVATLYRKCHEWVHSKQNEAREFLL